MLWYVAKLVVLLPLMGLLAWGSLKFARRMQDKMNASPSGERAARIVETTFLSPGLKLAVIEFRGREILVSTSRHGLTRLSEVPVRQPVD